MFRLGFFRVLLCLLICLVVSGQTKKVTLKDGRSVIGTVTEKGADYVVQTKFGPVLVPKDEVLSIEEYLTPEQEYRRRLGQINSDSPEDRFALGRWAFEKGLLEQAAQQLAKALELKGDYPRASLLLRQVRAKIAAQRPAPTDGPQTKPGKQALVSGDIKPDWLVTDKEIARIRLAELRGEDRAQIVFKNDLLNRFVEQMKLQGHFASPEDLEEFRRWPRARQVNYILETTGREGRDVTGDIVVKTDPRFMLDFRRQVWPIVARHCATADCHGAKEPVGGFRLFNITGRIAGVDYTNFLLLDSHQARGRKMIDRDYPEASLLLQYGLPRDRAANPHPGKIRPAFRDPSRRGNYLRVLQWLETLKGPPHPRYGVELRVPWVRKASAPTTQPASTQPTDRTGPDPQTP